MTCYQIVNLVLERIEIPLFSFSPCLKIGLVLLMMTFKLIKFMGFDSVPHCRLPRKIWAYGISGSLLEWLRDFSMVVHRGLFLVHTHVHVYGYESGWNRVISKIPQGSILGSVLFIIFVIDLLEVVGSLCKIFAEDCKFHRCVSNQQDQQALQKDVLGYVNGV